MLLWILFAVLTVVAALAVLLPLARGRRTVAVEAEHDLAVYRDQLAELERDRERGLIADREAEAARTEIARRLIRAGEAAGAEATAGRSLARPVALASMIFIPALSLGIYLALGSPDMPDQPLQARLDDSSGEHDVAAMVARVEAHLAQNPDDPQGWAVLAPIYMRLGRYGDAADAYRRILTLGEPTAETRENFGEALVADGQGLVSAEAQAAFEAAVAAEPDRLKARFYLALGLKQAGRNDAALAEYDEIIRRSPADAPWLTDVRSNRSAVLAALGRPADTPEPAGLPPSNPPAAAAPGPSEGDVAAASDMTPEARAAMIDGMVKQLADRLAADPNDAEGWTRLIRAYVVLGRADEAKAAYEKARSTFAADPAALESIEKVARETGVAG
jgi:cytochrome c-type biogenesis protein CcmH